MPLYKIALDKIIGTLFYSLSLTLFKKKLQCSVLELRMSSVWATSNCADMLGGQPFDKLGTKFFDNI